ncbi:bifunctional adenosylcobinamide kinase/adenosylcobinamide-phosphate guanylyltransferase [Paenibacillus sp. RRE4]|uniref:bifunctional adenosylcobinamide kinase/adenosylcobinamide-phosphate guanylyltransferase n=1 Tax=Paenibacillus sp. RRE4 TaxID=2962587 RepID=UPI0028822B85|nr:bifunctional adenosylcobinamide kinase/adenosylcobinamide-phosphate guanylyltransferase [Paenibacillus sp. RRE4]MDT0121516.1 bifunctional adenosylcobinamide kinase/adenosylcobinamide-phosphate guanylyltransferase [Paenibacillus sp. RRE4]
MSVLVTGGARSGKSSFAERLCMQRSSEAWYVATAQAYDDEMRERIAMHRKQREESGYLWRTMEEPLALPALIQQMGEGHTGTSAPTILVDCLTLWLTNVLLAHEHDEGHVLQGHLDALVEAVQTYPGLLVLVTNEVGDGIVPEYKLGRVYRDLAGVLNQRIATICREVFLVTVGIPIELKSKEYRL